MRILGQRAMRLLALASGFLILGFLPIQAREDISPLEARNHIKQQGIKYREQEFIKSVEEGSLDAAQLFLIAGKDANAENYSEESVLMIAAKKGSLEILHLLLEYGADVNTRGGFYRRSALTIAAEEGHLEIVKTLLEAGSDVGIKDKDGNTALLAAAGKNHAEIIMLLIEHGADVSVKDNNGRSPLEDIFITSIEEGNPERVQFFLTAGTDPNMKKPFFNAPVIGIAAEKGSLEIVKMLVQHGADVNLKNNSGETALMIAAAKEDAALIKFLLDNGADVKIKDKYERTPVKNFFITSVKEGDHESVIKLLKAGIHPNTKSLPGTSVLMLAVENGHPDIVKTLLERGADVDLQDSYDRTALDLAVQTGHPEIIEILRRALDIKSEK